MYFFKRKSFTKKKLYVKRRSASKELVELILENSKGVLGLSSIFWHTIIEYSVLFYT